MTLLSPENRSDIEQSFHVLDDTREGTISMDKVYTLWLGLGFDRTIPQADLAAHIPQDRHDAVTLDDVLLIMSGVSHDSWSKENSTLLSHARHSSVTAFS